MRLLKPPWANLALMATSLAPSPATGRFRWWAWPLTALVIALVNLPSLLRPAPPANACGVAEPVFGPFTRFQNCDAHVFNLIAADWSQLLANAGETRLGRPAYLAAGWLVDRALYVISFGALDPNSAQPPNYSASEVGYVLLNVALLTVALMLTWRYLMVSRERWQAAWGPIIVISVMIAVNPITKAFLWTAHTQMFTMVVPVVALLATHWALRSKITVPNAIALGVIFGVGILAYGSMAVAVISVIIALIVRRQWIQAAVIAAVTALLPLLWVLYATVVRGSFYSVETEKFRQFVWIADGLTDGTLISRIRDNFDWLLGTFADGQMVIAMLILAVAAIAAGSMALLQPRRSVGSHWGSSIAALCIVVATQVVFLYAMGFYQTRLTWGLVITLLLGAGFLAVQAAGQQGNRMRLAYNLSAVPTAMAWYAVWLTIPDPWF